MEGQNRTGIVRQLWYRLFIICKDNLKRWTVMHDIFTGDVELPLSPKDKRDKRFAVAALVILSSLAAGITGDLWRQHQTREDLLRLADQQNRMSYYWSSAKGSTWSSPRSFRRDQSLLASRGSQRGS